jgi:transposase InsO family protein
MADDGTQAKVITGVDDHSRYCVIAQVVARATGRAVCLAFAGALRRFGVPEEVLTDNGKQFTARFGHGGEVLFDRICRDNGIAHRLTPPASPTTTGKVERFHQSLRRELLDGPSRSPTWPPPGPPSTLGWSTTTPPGRTRPSRWPARPTASGRRRGPTRSWFRCACRPP